MGVLDPHKTLSIARDLSQKAGKIVLSLLNDSIKKERKADGSLVTEADLQANDLILKGLEENFPDHAILTEESGLSGNPDSPYTWVIDPLDGTKAFVKNIPGFCVMIGLLKDSSPFLGVVADPLEGHIYEAIRGDGAWHVFNGQRQKLQVSTRDHLDTMPLVISTGFPEDKLRGIREHLHGPILDPINSVGIKVGLLVRQKGDIYINHHPIHYWDTCAPQIILEEAGGIFTRMDGKPLTYDLKGGFSHKTATIATNNTRHEEIVKLVNSIF